MRESEQILTEYRQIQERIANLCTKYEEVLTQATHITPSYSESTGVHDNASKIELKAIKLDELNNQIREARQMLKPYNKALKQLKPYHNYLIREIGIKRRSVKEVSWESHRNYSSVLQAYKRACDSFVDAYKSLF